MPRQIAGYVRIFVNRIVHDGDCIDVDNVDSRLSIWFTKSWGFTSGENEKLSIPSRGPSRDDSEAGRTHREGKGAMRAARERTSKESNSSKRPNTVVPEVAI